MYSQEPRCLYRKNMLSDVICQLRFPEILTIGTEVPAKFQELIRDEFPVFSSRKEPKAPKFSGTPGNLQLEKQEPVINYQFASADGVWRINLTSQFISLACNRYPSWEEFAARLDKPLAAFIQTYRPAYFERVGLRYLNFFSRSGLDLSGIPFRELFTPAYLGLLSDEEIPEATTARCGVDADVAIRGGCRAKLHAGPGLIKKNGVMNQEVHFILDMDLYMPGKVEVQHSAPALQTLHGQAFPIFRGAITDTLHDAMDPISL